MVCGKKPSRQPTSSSKPFRLAAGVLWALAAFLFFSLAHAATGEPEGIYLSAAGIASLVSATTRSAEAVIGKLMYARTENHFTQADRLKLEAVDKANLVILDRLDTIKDSLAGVRHANS